MGTKFCPECKKITETKALSNYSQIEFRGILVKRRKIGQLEIDGGFGHTWYTVELPEDIIIGEGR